MWKSLAYSVGCYLEVESYISPTVNSVISSVVRKLSSARLMREDGELYI